jgi:Protein of unknown function (DUF3515)
MSVPDPVPDAASEAKCLSLLAHLPERVAKQSRRSVKPGRFAAAWGQPPLTLRCGVPRPPGLGATSQCFDVNGVGWFAEPARGGYLFTTIGRPAYVEVSVPSHYAPEAQALVDFATPINTYDPAERPCR